MVSSIFTECIITMIDLRVFLLNLHLQLGEALDFLPQCKQAPVLGRNRAAPGAVKPLRPASSTASPQQSSSSGPRKSRPAALHPRLPIPSHLLLKGHPCPGISRPGSRSAPRCDRGHLTSTPSEDHLQGACQGWAHCPSTIHSQILHALNYSKLKTK